MNVAICDNEELFFSQLKKILAENEFIDSVEVYSNIEKMFSKLEEGENYDIVFMDIDWKNDSENGINFASRINEINPDIQIVFVTAFNDVYSENIFFEKLNLCGYLKKPIKPQYLKILLEKARMTIKKRESNILSIKNNGQIENIKADCILYLESRGHKVTITKNDGISFTYEKLDDIQKRLGSNFLRIHKSYLVNMAYISQFEGKNVVLNKEKKLPISKSSSREAKTAYLKYLRESIKKID